LLVLQPILCNKKYEEKYEVLSIEGLCTWCRHLILKISQRKDRHYLIGLKEKENKWKVNGRGKVLVITISFHSGRNKRQNSNYIYLTIFFLLLLLFFFYKFQERML
jgi:hypothetical protein